MTPETVQQLLALLGEEERLLDELIARAADLRAALLASDYPRIEAVGARMLQASTAIETASAARKNLVETACPGAETLDDLLQAADTPGMSELRAARDRLLDRAARLREAQETNARLVLSIIKLRDRWAAILEGHLSPTYSPQGQPTPREGAGFVSRSA